MSLVPAFNGGQIGHEVLAWEHEGNAAVRMGDWKLVRKGAAGSWELYDMARDRTELTNLADRHPGRIQAMAELWKVWADRTHVFPKPGGNPGGQAK